LLRSSELHFVTFWADADLNRQGFLLDFRDVPNYAADCTSFLLDCSKRAIGVWWLDVSVSLFVAYLLFILADAAMYIGLFWQLKRSFKFHKFEVAAFLVLIAPFVYVLASAGGFFDLLWMLIFTPFYGLAIMILVYPLFMMVYYAVSFGSLFCLFLTRKRLNHWQRSRRVER
jgi:hypothetical protein